MPPGPVVLADLGKLSKLPLELLFMIIGYFDVPSAARFTRVNRRAQFLLWSDKRYQLLRYCLFRELSEKKSFWPYYIPLKDISYHALAITMSNLICTRCRRRNEHTYRLHVRTGYNLCRACYPRSLKLDCISIVTNCVEMGRGEIENTIPYRLPEGQLILSPPSIVEHYTKCFSRFRQEGRELVLKHSSRGAWDHFRIEQRGLICAGRYLP